MKPIQCTLAEYKATDPDPVEWAYLIIMLLCRGRTKDALERAGHFPWLRHTELDRVRLVLGSITNSAVGVSVNDGWKRCQRRSIHCLPSRDFLEWTRQLSRMLTACGQTDLAQRVVECAAHETVVLVQDSKTGSDDPHGLGARPPKNHNGAANAFKRNLFIANAQMALKQPAKNIVSRIEAKYGDLLPDCLKPHQNDEYFRAIQERASDESFRRPHHRRRT